MTKFVRAIKDFSGGLSEVANDNIPDNRLIVAKNAIPGDGYGISRAHGTSVAYEKIPTDGPVVLLVELEVKKNGEREPHVIAFTEKDALWNMWDWDGESWTQVSDATLDPSDPTDDMLPVRDWLVYDNKLLWLDGAHFRYYDGSEITEVANIDQTPEFWQRVQTAVAMEHRAPYWFFATNNNEILVSKPWRYDEFDETKLTNITSGVTDTITALHQFNDGLLIFQKRSIWYMTGWNFSDFTDVSLKKLSVESGTRWPKSIKTISNAVLYLGDHGVYRLSIPYVSSSVAASNVSEKQASRHLTEVNAVDVCAEVYDGAYYITLRTPTEILEYRYYLDSGAWWGEYTQRPYCYGIKLLGEDHLYIGCDNGYVLYYDDNSYHYIATATGTMASIPVEIKTKGYDVIGHTVVDSKVKRVFLVLKQYDAEKSGLEVQVKTDYMEGAFAAKIDSMKDVLTAVLRDIEGDESMVWSESIWGNVYWGWVDVVTKMFQLNRKCKRIQFVFRDDKDEPLLIYGIALQFKKKKAKGSRLGVTERAVRYDD